jgi:hypothetical protein
MKVMCGGGVGYMQLHSEWRDRSAAKIGNPETAACGAVGANAWGLNVCPYICGRHGYPAWMLLQTFLGRTGVWRV